ncbi:MAG: hypothetical protein GXO88_10860 [Chlorobi bacterium]|nr:hypothetical protein [Chlorobiota bacterium]
MKPNYNTFPKLKFLLIVVVFFIQASFVVAQQSLLETTLSKANKLRDEGDFGQTARLLSDFNNKYPGNIWVMRLYAETLYWMHEYDMAATIYEDAMRMHPDNLDVKYEYAIMLFDKGNYEYSQRLLDVYTSEYDSVAGAESLLGISNYYIGDFVDAERHLKKSLFIEPNDKRTREVYSEVRQIVRPWLKIDGSYMYDSQLLRQITPRIEGGFYKSHFLNLSFLLSGRNFSTDSINTTFIDFRLQNSFILPKAGFSAKVSAGLFSFTPYDQTEFTWSVSVKQKIAKWASLSAGAEKSLYTYTVASIAKPFTRNLYNFSAEWDKNNGWNIKTGYIGEFFPDSNNVQTFYAWALSPSIKFSVFELKFGYAFNYANSKENRYIAEGSLDHIVGNWVDGQSIKGVYDPYFTPKDQFSNSVLANLDIKQGKKTDIKLYASVGFYARAMNPYLYLNKKNSGKLEIRRDFYQESFTPLDMGINFNYNLSNNTVLSANYRYLQTFYFNSNDFNIGLKIFF